MTPPNKNGAHPHIDPRDRKTGAPHDFAFPRDPRHDAPLKQAHEAHTKANTNRLSIKIAGEAGFGIAVSGLILTKVLSRGGLSAMDYTEYPSLIRGGHNTFLLRVDEEKVHAPLSSVNVLIALNKASIFLHEHELSPDAALLYDSDEISLQPGKDISRTDLKVYGVPMDALAAKHGNKLMRNVVALGALMAITGYPLELLEKVIADVFGGKGKTAVIDANVAAAREGHAHVLDNHPEQFVFQLKPRLEAKQQIALTGGEAIALGAIAAGCQFYSAYPMTPASPVLHYLAAKQAETGMIVKHAEDEIAAINQAIGASFAGVRSMTGSAGGGFALMVEALGLAAITETPLVIMEAMRPGPATGLPTWTDQGDLRFIMHAAQGEFPRVILAPGDVDESFHLTHQAFNLADKYQLPVFVLTDKYLNESHFTTEPFDTTGLKTDRGKLVGDTELKAMKRRFKRYEITEDGVSPRSIPGQPNGIFLANSDESDEFGYTSEDANLRIAKMDKRFAKLKKLEGDLPTAKLHGPQHADITLIGWGSTKGPILEALKQLQHQGIKANFLQLVTMWPFPTKIIESTLTAANRTLLVEANYTSQLGGLIRQHTGIDLKEKLLKYDGRPIYPEEIYHRVKEVHGG